MRVVSLLPSATEIVCCLGAERSLVARSEECDYPPAVRHLPVVMRARRGAVATESSEIDAYVRAGRARGESLYEIDLAALRGVQPDLVLTQDLCSVCSVTGDEVRAACAATGVDPTILTLSPREWADVFGNIREVAGAIGRIPEGERLTESLEERVRRSAPARGATRSKVLVLEWLDPPIAAGLWTPTMIALAGGTAVGARTPGAPGVRTSWDALRRETPDLVVLSPCSFPVRRTQSELRSDPLARDVGSLEPSRGFWIADEAYFSRPGPRLVDGVELLASLLRADVERSTDRVQPWSLATAGAAT